MSAARTRSATSEEKRDEHGRSALFVNAASANNRCIQEVTRDAAHTQCSVGEEKIERTWPEWFVKAASASDGSIATIQ